MPGAGPCRAVLLWKLMVGSPSRVPQLQTATLSDIVYWVARHEILDTRLWNLLGDISTLRQIDCFEWCYRVRAQHHRFTCLASCVMGPGTRGCSIIHHTARAPSSARFSHWEHRKGPFRHSLAAIIISAERAQHVQSFVCFTPLERNGSVKINGKSKRRAAGCRLCRIGVA